MWHQRPPVFVKFGLVFLWFSEFAVYFDQQSIDMLFLMNGVSHQRKVASETAMFGCVASEACHQSRL